MSNKAGELMQVCLSRSWGGLEMAAFELAQDYNDRDHFVLTVCPRGSRLEEKLREHRLPCEAVDSKKYFSPSTTLQIRHLIKSIGIKTVVLHQLPDIWIVQPALIGMSEVKLLGFAHMFLSHSKKDFTHKFLYSRVNSIICLTRLQKENFLANLPIKEEQIVIIPNGVDTAKYTSRNRSEEVRKSLGGGDELLVGVIGRLDKLKGQVETVEAARILKDRGAKFKIVLVGEDTVNTGGTRSQLEKMIRDYDLSEQVILAGFRSDIPAVVASLDVLAMPSWAETFGRVLIEAMASRTPVIATSAGGVADIVENNVDGLLIPPRDPQALAFAIEKFIYNADLRESFGIKGELKARTIYASDIIQEQIDKVLLFGNTNA